METIHTDTRLAIRKKHNGRTDFIDEDGNEYCYPDPEITYCECEINLAKRVVKQLQNEYKKSDCKIELVKVREYVKITKL